MSIKHIRDKYHLPVKIGTIIHLNHYPAQVIWAPGAYLTVRTMSGKKETHHPFDFDYYINGEWVSGDELKRKYDLAWTNWNSQFKVQS